MSNFFLHNSQFKGGGVGDPGQRRNGTRRLPEGGNPNGEELAGSASTGCEKSPKILNLLILLIVTILLLLTFWKFYGISAKAKKRNIDTILGSV